MTEVFAFIGMLFLILLMVGAVIWLVMEWNEYRAMKERVDALWIERSRAARAAGGTDE